MHNATFTAGLVGLALISLSGCKGAETAAARAAESAVEPETWAIQPGTGCAADADILRLSQQPQVANPAPPAGLAAVVIRDAGMLESFTLTLPYAPQMPAPSPGPTLRRYLSFAVVRSGNLDGSLEVHYATSGGSATEYADFMPASGYVGFAPQETVKYIEVEVLDDGVAECAEQFRVFLTAAHPNAMIVDNEALGTVLDDDTTVDAGYEPGPDPGPPPYPEAAPIGNDYCESVTGAPVSGTTACAALSCATGQPLYWTHCPGTTQLHQLLSRQG